MARDRDSRDSRDRRGGGDREDRGDRGDRGGANRRRSGGGPRPRPTRRRGRRSEYCPEGKCFDYKDVETLERYVNEVGKIKPRRQTGNCARCQRELAREVKRARFIGLLPFISNTDY